MEKHIENLINSVENKIWTIKEPVEQVKFLKYVYNNTMIDRETELDATIIDHLMRLGLNGCDEADNMMYQMSKNSVLKTNNLIK